LIAARFREKVTLREASDALHAHPAHLVRVFSRKFGISPHQYLTSRRVDLARRLLLDGMPPGLAAAEAGFYDQSHLSRHFKHVLGTSPGRYARSGVESPRTHPVLASGRGRPGDRDSSVCGRAGSVPGQLGAGGGHGKLDEALAGGLVHLSEAEDREPVEQGGEAEGEVVDIG